MHKLIAALALAAAIGLASSAQAITIDGILDAGYGAAKSAVGFEALAPNSNFGAPTNVSDNVGYKIYLSSDASNVYGFLKASGPTNSLDFANLYFDIDPANNNGSDIGFEVTNHRGFVAGGSGYSPVSIGLFAGSGIVEFSIPNTYFMAPLSGLQSQYSPTQQFAVVGDKVTLRLSQSFGYSVAGGSTYGVDRLGSVILGGAVPEASTWAMMLLGFFGLGSALRARRGQIAAA